MSSIGRGETGGRGGGGTDLSENGDGDSIAPQEDQGGYLTPLQRSLVHELTSRREFIAAAKVRADFWEKRQSQSDIDEGLGSEDLDELIKTRSEELSKLKEIKQVKEAIVQAADSSHVMNKALASTSPAILDANSNIPLSQLPLRNLAAKRDKLALEYLRYDTQIKHVRTLRREVAEDIAGTRRQTTALLKDVRARSERIQKQQGLSDTSDVNQREKYAAVMEALQTAKGKREMVKGVLRGLILESGLDWYGNKRLRELMLSLGDDDLDASEEEPDFETDDDDDESLG